MQFNSNAEVPTGEDKSSLIPITMGAGEHGATGLKLSQDYS